MRRRCEYSPECEPEERFRDPGRCWPDQSAVCPRAALCDVIKARTLAAARAPRPRKGHDGVASGLICLRILPMNIELAREQMIEQQVHAWDVFDERVLTTMRQVRREQFAPSPYGDIAFADAPI